MIAKGSELADEQLPRPDRRDDDLLHRADLLLAHDPHGREQHGHDHQDHGQHRGHVEPAALEVGVVEDARHEDGLADGGNGGAGRAQAPLQDGGAEVAGEGRRVAEGDVGGGGVGAVDDQLDGGRPAGGERRGRSPGRSRGRAGPARSTSQRSTSAARSPVPTISK